MPKAEMILSPIPAGRQSSLPFRQLLAWRRQCRANAIRRHQALRRGEPEVVAFIDIDALDPNKQQASRLSFNAWEAS